MALRPAEPHDADRPASVPSATSSSTSPTTPSSDSVSRYSEWPSLTLIGGAGRSRVPGDPVRAGAGAVQRLSVEPVERDAPVVDPAVVDRRGQPRAQVVRVVHVAALGERRAGVGRSAAARRPASAPSSSASTSPPESPGAGSAGCPRSISIASRRRSSGSAAARSAAAADGAGEHDQRDVAALARGGRGRVVVGARQQLVAVGDLGRDRGRDARRGQPGQQPARLRQQHVEHEAERQHPDRPARERQVERDRDRRRAAPPATTLHDGVLAPARGQVQDAAARRARRRRPSRSSRSAGTRRARAGTPLEIGKVSGSSRVSSPASAIAANAAAVQRSNMDKSPTRAATLPVRTRTRP